MDAINKLLEQKILVLDGATGTMLQKFNLTEDDYRKGFFEDSPIPLKGNNDLLNLTHPESVEKIHAMYLDAGADIIETNTFNANRISQAEYGLASYVPAINRASAALAKRLCTEYTRKNPDKPRFCAGSIGPTSRTLSMSGDVNDPGGRALFFDELFQAYHEQISALADGGIDILLIETAFDTLNVKAAIHAAAKVCEEKARAIPVMISCTLSDASGRLLSGQSLEAFIISVSHCPNLISTGINCALGAEEMRPHIEEMAAKSPFFTSAHPNAGLPDESGKYTQEPQQMAAFIRDYAEHGLLNIAGGCCGTTPEHIKAIAEAVKNIPPRKRLPLTPRLRLAGLDPLVGNDKIPFINVGERTNVAGSRKFLRLIKENNIREAMRIASKQIEDGALVIDVNMDDAMLDAAEAMKKYLLNTASEPDIARVPVMVDSSNWNVVEAGLKCVQGKCIVNSISLKEGETKFLEKARKAKLLGAAVLAMAFDEQGQADTVQRRVAVCERMYKLLTEKAAFAPEDIIFDPNVFAVATGMPEHDSCAADFIEAVKIIHEKMPLTHISGGISNVSFSFRGNETVRQALHCVFLYHAVRAGLDMGIVNPSALASYTMLPDDLREAAENVILNKSPDAGEKLLAVAAGTLNAQSCAATGEITPEWRKDTLENRIKHALVKGDDSFAETDMLEALEKFPHAADIIEGPLMDGMAETGRLFGEGKLFLPQVVKTARVMKACVEALTPALERESGSGSNAGTVVLATVKGDVHDIGKNIVSVILKCNNFRVIDLGVMTPCRTIIDTAIREKADFIALSGLITPSLEEMRLAALEMEREHMTIPLFVGGAATGLAHTAVKLAPCYSGPVVWTRDASQIAQAMSALSNKDKRASFIDALEKEYAKARNEKTSAPEKKTLPYPEANSHAYIFAPETPANAECGIHVMKSIPLEELEKFINYSSLAHAWSFESGRSSQARKAADELADDAKRLFEIVKNQKAFTVSAVFGIWKAEKRGNDILLSDTGKILPMMRKLDCNQKKICPCLADFVKTHAGLFALNVQGADAFAATLKDDYSAILAKLLADRTAEACAEYLDTVARKKFWDYKKGIRPATGYPSCPDHTLKRDIFELLSVEENIAGSLTESYMMRPAASVCGLWLEDGFYFDATTSDTEQNLDYAKRRGRDWQSLEKYIHA